VGVSTGIGSHDGIGTRLSARRLHPSAARAAEALAATACRPGWGISNPYLSQIERGLREPSEKVLDAIARNLELSAEGLYEQGGRRRGEEDDGRSRQWWRRFAPIAA
jgi:transcriptional regulator with XRE-family HTH domain